MKLIRTEDAVGQVLCHDITQIIPGQFKGARFRKGHIVQPEDIPVLLSIGKENLYVWEKRPGILHEDEEFTPRVLLQAQRVVEALRGTRCDVALSTDFTTVAWRKLLQNAVAGLMVLANRRAGMFRREDISELALAYLREGLTVARAEGAKLDDAVAEEILANFQRAPVDLGTSILADRQADRPMEWDIRNGVIQRYGRRHGIAVPISDVVVPLLAAGSEGPG
jgi:ketopantoate reductase